MTDLIDLDVIDDVEDVHELTPDQTIGRCVLPHGAVNRGDVMVDLRRLRRMLLAYEQAYDSRYAWMSARESPNGLPVVTLQNSPEATDFISLAGRTPTEEYPQTEEVLEP